MSTNNTSQNYEISPESESIETMNEVPKVTKTVKKEKNPNRVAAGKRLAEYNRKQKRKIATKHQTTRTQRACWVACQLHTQ